MYKITNYSYNKLNELNNLLNTDSINIKSSNNKNKKIDVFINDVKIASIGNNKYMDYPNYIKENGKQYADERRKLYYQRHKKEDSIKNGKITPSWFAKYFLW